MLLHLERCVYIVYASVEQFKNVFVTCKYVVKYVTSMLNGTF